MPIEIRELLIKVKIEEELSPRCGKQRFGTDKTCCSEGM